MSGDNGKPEPDTVAVSIPITINFPMTMFLPTGALEHRLHRSKFLQQIMNLNSWMEIYDRHAETARQKLIEVDPQTIRPPLEKLGAVMLDVGAIAKAMVPDDEDGTEQQ